MKKIALFLLFLSSLAYGQGVRVGDAQPIQAILTDPSLRTSTGATPKFITAISTASLSFCLAPANGVPCFNKATTYTDATLTTSCPTNAQIVLAGTNTCVANPDANGNWGVWVGPGQYNFTITINGASQGPFPVTAGGSGGSSFSLLTNSVANGSQSILNLIQGSNVTLVDNGIGGVIIASSGGGGGGGGLPDPGGNGLVARTALNTTIPVPNVATGYSLASMGTGNPPMFQQKAIYDSRDWMTCDGVADASGGMNTLLSTIGSTNSASINFVGPCRIGNTNSPANITLDFSGGGSASLISSTTIPGGAGFVNGTSAECGAGASCIAPALAVTAGNTLIAAVMVYPGFTFKTTSVTDSCGNAYLHFFQSLVGQPRNQGIWVASNANAGSCVVTTTANGSLTTSQIIVQQFSGMGPVVSKDGQGASTNSTGATMSSGAATTTAGSLLVACGGPGHFHAETVTAGAGFTQPAGLAGQTANGYLQCEYKLSSAGGAVTATANLSVNPSPDSWVYSQLPLKVGSATLTILGGVNNPDAHQIFLNGDGAAGHGAVDFTGNTTLREVRPEWWGANASATAAVNRPALQAAIWGAFGCGPLFCRDNASGLAIYNKTLVLTGQYSINDELKWYHVVGASTARFSVVCNNGGITQTVANKRIIDAQSMAYGNFYNCAWNNAASSTNAITDIDFSGAQGADLAPQFLDFWGNSWIGNGTTDVGFLLSKSGGGAQGSNIYCYDCASQGFTGAAWQIGGNNTGRNVGRFSAGNALDIGYSGDIQSSPLYGIAVYGGGYVSFSGSGNSLATMENGFSTQTGCDIYGEQTQGPLIMEHMRSESRVLACGSNLRLIDARTINQAASITPGGSAPVGTIYTGNKVTSDGAYYKVTINGGAGSPFGGAGTVASPILASSGTGTSITDTNQTVVGSQTIGTFVSGETVTQAVTGSTGTLRNVPVSTATVTGIVTSGVLVFNETVVQGTTGITAQVLSPTPTGVQNLLLKNLSGTADNSHTWVGGTSGAVYTPSAAPTFSVASPAMLISAATGSPNNSNNWVGGTSAAVYVPTAVPTNVVNFTVNAFTGMLVGIQAGTAINCYGVVTSNTATSITYSAGLTTKYPLTSCPTPDSTSTFIVEPNWNHGTVVSGGMTLAYMNEDVIRGDDVAPFFQGMLQDVIVSGGQIKPWGNASAKIMMKNVSVSRADWFDNTSGNSAYTCCMIDRDWDVRPILPGASTPINWALPASVGIPYMGGLHNDVGGRPFCWTVGTTVGNAASDVCIGGRSDPNSGATASRNILEIPAGMLGRGAPLPAAANSFNITDQTGTDFDITGGPSTGSGTGGAINLWTSNPSGSSSTPNSGVKRWTITGAGNLAATGAMNITTTGTVTAASATFSGPPSISTGTASNTDLAGRITLGGGTGTYTFAGTYATAPVCTATDTTAVNAVRAATSTTTLTLTGTGTDVIAFICVGLN